MPRGVTEIILKILQFNAETAINILDIMLSDRQELMRKQRKLASGGALFSFKTDWAKKYRKRQAFHSLLAHMKKEGFVKKEEKKNGKWNITAKGVEYIKSWHKEGHSHYSFRSAYFQPSEKKELTIVAFDIPEKEHKKRRWLRMCLVSMEFSRLQKSVWWSSYNLPEDFVRALHDRNMLEYVHIFAVSRGGTLTKVS